MCSKWLKIVNDARGSLLIFSSLNGIWFCMEKHIYFVISMGMSFSWRNIYGYWKSEKKMKKYSSSLLNLLQFSWKGFFFYLGVRFIHFVVLVSCVKMLKKCWKRNFIEKSSFLPYFLGYIRHNSRVHHIMINRVFCFLLCFATFLHYADHDQPFISCDKSEHMINMES